MPHFTAHGRAKQAPEDAKAEAEADEGEGKGFLVYPAAWSRGRGNTAEANRMEK